MHPTDWRLCVPAFQRVCLFGVELCREPIRNCNDPLLRLELHQFKSIVELDPVGDWRQMDRIYMDVLM